MVSGVADDNEKLPVLSPTNTATVAVVAGLVIASRRRSDEPLLMTPSSIVNGPPSMLYEPPTPATVIGASGLSPATTTALLVTNVPGATPATLAKISVSLLFSSGTAAIRNGTLMPATDSTASVALPKLLLARSCRRIWAPLLTLPGVVVQAPPSTLYEPPVTDTATAVLMPLTVTTLLITGRPGATFFCSSNSRGSGLSSIAAVLSSQLPATPPMVSTAVVVVENCEDETCRRRSLSPLLTVELASPKAWPLTLYWPPETDTGAAALMPLTVIGALVWRLSSGASTTAGKPKASGVVSAVPVVTA